MNEIEIEIQGKKFRAVPVDIVNSRENWNDYILEDGTEVRIKLLLVSAVKKLGIGNDKDSFNYHFEVQSVVAVKTQDKNAKRI